MARKNSFLESAYTGSKLGGKGYNGSSIRPLSADSLESYMSADRLTKEQHQCINNLGMASVFFLPIGLISAAVAMGTNYWFNIQSYNVGLIKRCDNWTQICSSVSGFYDQTNYDKFKSTWKAGVPLEFAGTSLLALGLLILICYPCHRKVNFSKIACAFITAIILLLGLSLTVAATAMFISYALTNTNRAKVMWSFYCAIAGAALSLIAVTLFWVHLFYMKCFG